MNAAPDNAALDRVADVRERAEAYSFGMAAVILLRLDGRPGEWIAPEYLAQHLQARPDTVRRHCEGLADARQLEAVRGVGGVITAVRVPHRVDDEPADEPAHT